MTKVVAKLVWLDKVAESGLVQLQHSKILEGLKNTLTDQVHDHRTVYVKTHKEKTSSSVKNVGYKNKQEVRDMLRTVTNGNPVHQQFRTDTGSP